MSTFKQLVKEFWIPLAFALLWTAYNTWTHPRSEWTTTKAVNIFGPTFFFCSWLLSQWYRIRKQQKVEGGLASIELTVKQTLADLDAKTKDLVGYVTGGDSACYLLGTSTHSNQIDSLFVSHVGKHPLYDVSARIVDLQAFDELKDKKPMERFQGAQIQLELGTLIQGHGSLLPQRLDLGNGQARSFNVFYTARNGSFSQLLRFRRVGSVWAMASKVHRDNVTLHEHVDQHYPRESNGEIEW